MTRTMTTKMITETTTELLFGLPVIEAPLFTMNETALVLGIYQRDGTIVWSEGIYTPEDRGWDDFEDDLARRLSGGWT